MVSRTCASFAPQPPFVLQHVVTKLVGEHMTDHEPRKSVGRPINNTVHIDGRARVAHSVTLVL